MRMSYEVNYFYNMKYNYIKYMRNISGAELYIESFIANRSIILLRSFGVTMKYFGTMARRESESDGIFE